MLQTRFAILNDPCDETLLQIVACLNCLAFIISIFGDRNSADACSQIIDCINGVVCACMLTQHDIEIKRIEAEMATKPGFYVGIPQTVLFVLPPQQQTMIQGFAPYKPIVQPGTPQYGAAPVQGVPAAVAAPRQITLTVPEGSGPGQMVQFTSPEGQMCQVPVPAGVSPGQQFTAAY